MPENMHPQLPLAPWMAEHTHTCTVRPEALTEVQRACWRCGRLRRVCGQGGGVAPA